MTHSGIFVCLLLVAYPNFSDEINFGEVVELNKDNFEKTTASNQFVLVEFYAPWCQHCRAFAPEYARTAKLLKEINSPVTVGKVNVEEEKALAEEHGVRSYPTVKLFENGYPTDYMGGRRADNIVDWLKMKTG